MYLRFLALLFTFTTFSVQAQINFDFNSGDLNLWKGDISEFRINENDQLQLNAPEAGQSLIYTETNFPDSLFWNMDISLSFSPSGSNQLTIILAADNIDLSQANGYILKIGESGSDDAIRFIQLENGNETEIASGIMGNVASSFDLTFDLNKTSLDEWTLITTDNISQQVEEEMSFIFNDDEIITYNIFGFLCNYTASRAENFFFDNIIIDEIKPDKEGPIVNSVNIIDAKNIKIRFNESVNEASAIRNDNYSFSNAQLIETISFDMMDGNVVDLFLAENLPSGQSIELSIQNITDLSGNQMNNQVFEIALTEEISVGDIVINEILFDPYTGGEDFVEIFNRSEKTLNLEGLIIRNVDKVEDEIISREITMAPGQIIAFSKDPQFLLDQYIPPNSANVILQDLPSFNNSDGNATLLVNKNGEEVLIDEFDYDQDYHFDLLKDTEGVSLERISTISPTNDPNNWFSAAQSVLFASPGYENSVRSNSQADSNDPLSLEYQSFSPNLDGNKDLLIINYNLDKTGYVANISIFDDRGRFEKHLIRNQLLATQGVLNWDGTLKNGNIGPVGMYIIYYEFFHSDGSVLSGKKVCVLAQPFN